MGNRSIYFNDDEDEWIEENINNVNLYIRKHVQNDMKENHQEIKERRNKNSLGFLLCVVLMILGITVLLFSIIMYTNGIKTPVTLDYGMLVGLLLGIILEGIAIRYMIGCRKNNKETSGGM
jgi:uncharacterized membrane-anchored protein